MTYCTRWSKNVSLACLQRLEVLQGIRSLLAPEPCNRTMVVSWWKTCWLGFKLGIPITQKGVSSKDNCGVCRWRIQPQEDVVYLRQWIDIEMTKWQEMERSRILLVKQPRQAWESSRHDAQIFLMFSLQVPVCNISAKRQSMRSFKKPNVDPCSSQNVSNITSFKYHDSKSNFFPGS